MVETDVGDRYVLEALEKGGWSLGGEQSGHVIFRDLATTGDGILTGLQVLDVVVRSGRPLAELAAVSGAPAPGAAQRAGGVRAGRWPTRPSCQAAIAEVEAGLGDAGPGPGAGQRHRARDPGHGGGGDAGGGRGRVRDPLPGGHEGPGVP